MLSDWIDITIESLKGVWEGFIDFIPRLVGALILFIIGWIISVAIGKLVAEILRKIKFNKIFEKGGWKLALEKAEIKVDASGFIGAIFKWVLMIVFLAAAIEILGFVQLTGFLTDVLNYLPNVIVAAFIFVIAVIIADILEKVVRAAVESVKVGYGQIVGAIVKWSIWVFAILAILSQLKIEAAGWIVNLINIVFIGIVAMMAIAFGLGGKEVAAEIVRNLKNKFKG